MAVSRVLVALVCVMCVFLGGCGDTVTDENFDQITVGMRLQEVEDIMGDGEKLEVSGTSISGAGVAGSSRPSSGPETYEWRSGNKIISVTVKDGVVLSKMKNWG